jgi:hypothetical protein
LYRFNELKEENSQLILDTADYDLILRDNEMVKQEQKELQKDLRTAVVENEELLNKRTEYNFDATLRFDEILREFITSLYVESRQMNAVGVLRYVNKHTTNDDL